MNGLAGIICNYYDRPIPSSERMLYKDYVRRCSIEENILAVSLNGLGAKTN
jgi:hypothetical protein